MLLSPHALQNLKLPSGSKLRWPQCIKLTDKSEPEITGSGIKVRKHICIWRQASSYPPSHEYARSAPKARKSEAAFLVQSAKIRTDKGRRGARYCCARTCLPGPARSLSAKTWQGHYSVRPASHPWALVHTQHQDVRGSAAQSRRKKGGLSGVWSDTKTLSRLPSQWWIVIFHPMQGIVKSSFRGRNSAVCPKIRRTSAVCSLPAQENMTSHESKS